MQNYRGLAAVLLAFSWLLAGNQAARAQNYAGYWLGVTYPSDPNNEVLNYFANFTQNGPALGGTGQTADPTLPFGGVSLLKGSTTATKVNFKESDPNGSLNTPLTCYWDFDLVYNPAEESLKGTYKSIYNRGYCEFENSGKVELYRIVLKSGSKYCKGQPVDLTVTGRNIKWYNSANKNRLLAQGNNYKPNITETTTYYITQTLYKTESPAIPIEVKIVNVGVDVTAATAPGCGKSDGTIALAARGSDNYQYSVDGGTTYQASSRFSGLAAGNYKIKVKDDAGCTAESATELKGAAAPTISDVKAQAPACGKADGKLTVTATGGTGLQYSVDGTKYQASSEFTDLAAGNYKVSVRDAAGCTAESTTELKGGSAPTISDVKAQAPACGKSDGKLTVTATGGLGLQYSVDGTNFQTSPEFAGLAASTYKVSVKNAAGCTAESDVDLKGAAAPVISDVKTQQPACGQANGQLTVAATGGMGLQYSLDGTTYQPSNVFDKLSGGNFTILVKDAAGCTVSKSATLASAGTPQTVTTRPTPTSCGQDNGEITMSTSAIDPRFSLDGTVFKPGNSFRNLAAGDYTVTMKDTAGCIATSKVTITTSVGPSLGSLTATPVSCGGADGKLTVQATGNGLQYALDAGSPSTTGTFGGLEAREYELTVTDANNCVISQKVSLVSGCRNMVFIPSGFSPNDDGQNDQLTVHFTAVELTFKTITVYNRWGIAVHSRQDALLRSGDALWDGKFREAAPNADMCIVVAEVLFDDGSTHVFRQSVEILR